MDAQSSAEARNASSSSGIPPLRIPRRPRASATQKLAEIEDTRPLEERVSARNEELLAQKRQDLARVLDGHDDLVREDLRYLIGGLY